MSKECLHTCVPPSFFTGGASTVVPVVPLPLPIGPMKEPTPRDTYNHYVRMAKVFVAWKFYRDALVQEAANTGLPVARPVVVHYQGDPKTYIV